MVIKHEFQPLILISIFNQYFERQIILFTKILWYFKNQINYRNIECFFKMYLIEPYRQKILDAVLNYV